MILHQCQIVNDTNQTILLKIIGSGPNSNYTPDIPGVQTGLMFAASPQNVDLHNLAEGERVVIVWDSNGSKIKAFQKILLNAPATIRVKLAGTTTTYSVEAVDGSGNDISI
jgi:hypothetical protein